MPNWQNENWPDGKTRCGWASHDPLYMDYHDTEWGVPEHDSHALFEKLILDGFQAGLSWITILRKRDNFRRAFDGFNPEIMARYTAEKHADLMQDAGIIRNRAKIAAASQSARAFLEIPDFSAYLWNFTDGGVIDNHPASLAEIPAETELSRIIGKDLKKRGFNFCGPTIVYAFMQAVGMVNDHVMSCHCRSKI